MALPTLDDGHRLLICLAVAVRARDPVLVKQVADRAERILPDSAIRRTFGRLRNYGVSPDDLAWLSSVDL